MGKNESNVWNLVSSFDICIEPLTSVIPGYVDHSLRYVVISMVQKINDLTCPSSASKDCIFSAL